MELVWLPDGLRDHRRRWQRRDHRAQRQPAFATVSRFLVLTLCFLPGLVIHEAGEGLRI